ncbi:MAG: branched-chain amino acid transport system substrate-binding protein [Bradyrhizobium sp.]
MIRRTRRKKACVCCDRIVQVPAASRLILHSVAGPGLLAPNLVAKFADHQRNARYTAEYKSIDIQNGDFWLQSYVMVFLNCKCLTFFRARRFLNFFKVDEIGVLRQDDYDRNQTGEKSMRSLVFLIILLFAVFAKAETSGEKIVIGQSIELSGQATGKENMQGAQAYFAWVNSQGGVHGRQLELKTYDDQRDPKKTRFNTGKLLRDDQAIALFGYRSTPTVEAALPLLQEYKVAMVAPFSGAASLHSPFNPFLFHLRASYEQEAVKMVESLKILQITKVAILYQEDNFGRDGLAGFERSLASLNIKAIVAAKYDRKDLNVGPAVDEIAAVNPQAVLMACTPSACADFIKQMRKKNVQTQFMMLSNVNSDDFFKSLGEDGRGIGVMQVMPFPRDIGAAVVRDFQKVLKTMANPPPASYATLEGFVAAKLITDALRRTGPHPTRHKLLAALESMHEADLGGVSVNYSSSNHEGSHFVELVVVGKNGVIWR